MKLGRWARTVAGWLGPGLIWLFAIVLVLPIWVARDDAVAVAAIVTAVIALGVAGWAVRGDRSKGRRRCPKCWYDMTGTATTCPECGRTQKHERRFFRTRRRWRTTGIAAVTGMVLVAAFCGRASHKWIYRSPPVPLYFVYMWFDLPVGTETTMTDRLTRSLIDQRLGKLLHDGWTRTLLVVHARSAVVNNDDAYKRTLAAEVLGSAMADDRGIDALLVALEDEDDLVREYALISLCLIAPDREDVRVILEPIASELLLSDSWYAHLVLDAYAASGGTCEQILDSLRVGLSPAHHRTRLPVLRFATREGNCCDEMIGEIYRLILHDDRYLSREYAIRAFGRCATPSPDQIDDLMLFFESTGANAYLLNEWIAELLTLAELDDSTKRRVISALESTGRYYPEIDAAIMVLEGSYPDLESALQALYDEAQTDQRRVHVILAFTPGWVRNEAAVVDIILDSLSRIEDDTSRSVCWATLEEFRGAAVARLPEIRAAASRESIDEGFINRHIGTLTIIEREAIRQERGYR